MHQNCCLMFALASIILAACIMVASGQNAAPTFVGCTDLNTTYVSGVCKGGLIQIKEEVPIDTPLFVVNANDADGDSVEFTITGDTTLFFFFKLSLDTAARKATVIVNSRIDAESMSTSLATLKLRMNDLNGNVINDNNILIFILDQNDNPPEFQNLPYRWQLPENTVGTNASSFNVSLLDRDKTPSTFAFTYVVIPTHASGTPLFNETSYTKSTTAAGTVHTSTVSLLQPLDYEAIRFYQISVFAVEAGADGKNATTDIVLNVEDQQDTPPTFQSTPYQATLAENSALGTTVVTAEAVDGDRGVPNSLSFFIDNSSSPAATLFSMNSSSGVMTVAGAIDRESSLIQSLFSSFSLNIFAQENSAQPANLSRTYTTVRITISDVNDVAPTFSAAAYNATVIENSAAGSSITMLATCSVTDTDDRSNAEFNISARSNGTESAIFSASPATGLSSASVTIFVRNSALLDYETTKTFEFELVAFETKTAERRSSTASVTVFLLDANDNTPVFNQTKFTFSIAENSPNGTVVGDVFASDRDSGSFATITYSIGGTDANKFQIDSSTGRIVVNVNADTDLTQLNRETVPTIFLTVQATDGGGLTGSSQLEIILTDRNDMTPAFQRTQYTGTLRENSVAFESAVQVTATDSDLSPNNIITYSLLPGNASASFGINSSTGELSVLSALDYESLTSKTLQLWAVATDGGTPALSSSVLVRLTIEDQNDMAPSCSQAEYNASIKENATFNTLVATLAGSDGDSAGSVNSEIFFRILLGGGDRFGMDSAGSSVVVERGADLDVTKFGLLHNLTIGVYDRGSPQLSSSCLLIVNVADVNNKAPYFDPVTTSVTVSEGAAVGSVITVKSATDLDSTANLSYQLLDSGISGRTAAGAAVASSAAYNFSQLLSINSSSGAISVAGTLDREVAQQLTLPVLVRDLNAEMPTPTQTATGTVVLTLTDINNKPPRFLNLGSANNFSLSVSESSLPPVAINLKVIAEDPDSSTLSLSYGLQPASLYFQIDSSSGQLSLIKKLDYETQPFHTFQVTVSDGVHVVSATVTVEVLNTNSYSPVFDGVPAALNFLENITVGTVIVVVRATDNDTGVFGQLEYQLLTGDTFFSVNSSSGAISLRQALDRDVSGGSQQILVVEAVDNPGGVDRKRTSQRLVVNVLDVNDSPPRFPSSNFTFRNVRESFVANHEVGEVQASDRDEGVNSQITYSLAPLTPNATLALQLFRVETVNTSAGSVAKILVNETLTSRKGWYDFALVAADGGSPSLQGTTGVTIFIAESQDFTVQDDGELGRIRSALISTTLILIAACAVLLFLMARFYLRYKAAMRIHDLQAISGAAEMNSMKPQESGNGNLEQKEPDANQKQETRKKKKKRTRRTQSRDSDFSTDSQAPAGRQSRPISAAAPAAPGLSQPDTAPLSATPATTAGSSATGMSAGHHLPPLPGQPQLVQRAPGSAAGDAEPLFPRSFTLLKSNDLFSDSNGNMPPA